MSAEISQQQPDLPPQISRRTLLKILGGEIVVLSGLAVWFKGRPRYWPSAPEAEDIDSDLVRVGVTVISKGVNLRTSPNIPNRTKFRSPDNRISWEDIEAVNGTPLRDRSRFLIINPTIVNGQNTWINSGSNWMRLMIQSKGEADSLPHYLSLSHSTEEFVEFLGYAGYASFSDEYGIHKLESKSNFPNDIDRVVIPENPETMARDVMPELWAERMRKKFEGDIGFYEQIVQNLQIVPGEVVHVRDYPSLEYGNGEPVTIIGNIVGGTIISKALILPDDNYHYNFVAIKSEDIQGPLIDGNGNPVLPSSGKVFAIYRPYLQSVA